MLGKKRCCCNVTCDYLIGRPSSGGVPGVTAFSDLISSGAITVISGTWTTASGGRLRVTGPGKILINVPQPDSQSRMRLAFASNTAGGGGTAINYDAVIRLFVDYTDDDNCHYAEGHLWSGFGVDPETEGKIARVSGGSETVLWNRPFNYYVSDVGGGTLSGSLCVQDDGVHFSNKYYESIFDPIPDATSATGGLYAAIEVIQGEGEAYEFDEIGLSKISYPGCPTGTCDRCLQVPGACAKIPASGFSVGISGVVDGPTGGSTEFSGVAANFNQTFVVDEINSFYTGTLFFETAPCQVGYTASFARSYAWRSAVFELDPVIVYTEGFYSFNYTYGRVVLVPRYTDLDPCTVEFDLILQISQSDNDTCVLWLCIAAVEPSTYSGNDVNTDCTALDGATFSDNVLTSPHGGTGGIQENIVFTVTAL